MRLRDLAGLIVIDFIDMEDGRNDRDVEKRLHNAVKNDRARVQIGKISQFGLLEMSRQRLRAGVVAGSTVPCPHCGGQGIVRSVESTSLRVLRGLEEEAQKQRAEGLVVRVAGEVAIYTLNQKRRELARLEAEYDIAITFEPKDELKAGNFDIERIGQRDPESRPRPAALIEAATVEVEAEVEPEIVEEEIEETEEAPRDETQGRNDTRGEGRGDAQPSNQQTGEGGRRKRRRRRRGGRDRERPFNPNDQHREPQPFASNGEPAAAGCGRTGRPPACGRIHARGYPTERHWLKAARHEQQGAAGEGAPSPPPPPWTPRRTQSGKLQRGTARRQRCAAIRAGAARIVSGSRTKSIRRRARSRVSHPAQAIPNASSTPVWSLKAEGGDQPARKAGGRTTAGGGIKRSELPLRPLKRAGGSARLRSD